MNILINCSNLRVGGGIQVAHSFINELKKIHKKSDNYIVVTSTFLQKQLCQATFPENFIFVEYTIKPTILKAFLGNDKMLDTIVANFKVDIAFSIFGPAYWKPKSIKHICGFAKPDYIFKDSPFFKTISLKDKIKLSILEFLHMFDIKFHTNLLITENPIVSQILAKKVNQPVITVSNYYNQVFDDESSWDKSLKLSFDENTIKLICISANYPHKNLQIIRKVIPEIKKINPNLNFQFILTIDKDEFGVINDAILLNHILFLGKVNINQCPYLYQQCDFLFFPTLLECFSASYCEAMFMEKPILTSNLPFAKGICENAALYFDPLNPTDIADKIVNLATNINSQNKLILNGKNQLKKFDTSNERAQKYLKIIAIEHADQK